jgi:hypothetical protein
MTKGKAKLVSMLARTAVGAYPNRFPRILVFDTTALIAFDANPTFDSPKFAVRVNLCRPCEWPRAIERARNEAERVQAKRQRRRPSSPEPAVGA